MSGVLEAKRIRKKIDQLQHYRRMGVRTITEGILYEKQMRQNPSDSLPVADSTVRSLPSLPPSLPPSIPPTNTFPFFG